MKFPSLEYKNQRELGGRNIWVDSAKGVGIVLVVYGHAARGLHSSGIEMPGAAYEMVDSFIYSFHMPLFFFLSGLFFRSTIEKRGGCGTILSKVDTIVYPYILWSLAQGFVEVGLSGYTNGSVGVSSVLSLWNPRAQFWFLYALFFIFAFYVAAFKLSPGLFAPACFVFLLVQYIFPAVVPDFYLARLIAANGIFFAAGLAFFDFKIERFFSSRAAVGVFVALFFLGQFVFHNYGLRADSPRGVWLLLLSMLSILGLVFLVANLSEGVARWVAYIGGCSMVIYVLHILFASGVRIVLYKLFGVDDYVIHLVVGLIAGLLGPILVYELSVKLGFKYLLSAPLSSVFIKMTRK